MVDRGTRASDRHEIGRVDFALTHLQASYDSDRHRSQIRRHRSRVADANRRHP